MNWLKQNPFLAGLLAATVVGGGALGFLLFQGYTSYSTSRDAYTAAIQKLHALQNRVPFPNTTNLDTIKSSYADYVTAAEALRESLHKMELPLDPAIKPQQFQDQLRLSVDEIKSKAKANNVGLPADFYLGFNNYKDKLPANKAAPYLDRQLRAIDLVVTRLIDYKIQSIDKLSRSPLPEESSAPEGAKPSSGVSFYPLELTFVADQAKLRVAFNSLLNSDQFFVVRSLQINNSSPQGPPKEKQTAASSFTPSPQQAASASASQLKPNEMKVLLGRERLTVTIIVEMVDFTFPEPKES